VRRFAIASGLCVPWLAAIAAILPPELVAMAPDAFGLPRPYRLGIWQYAREVEAKKPIGLTDAAGFIPGAKGTIFGALDKNWVGVIDFATGKPQWLFGGVDFELTTPPIYSGDDFFVGFRSGAVVRLGGATGKKIWEQSLESFSERTPVIRDGVVYIYTSSQVLYALDAASGNVKWLFDAGFPDGLVIRSGSDPLVRDDDVIIGTSKGEVIAVQRKSGNLLWRYNPAVKAVRFSDVVGRMSMESGRLVVARHDGLVLGMDPASGTAAGAKVHMWQDELPTITTAEFANGRIYVGCLNGDIYSMEAATGRKVWRANVGASVATIAALNNELIIGGEEGRVASLSLESGEIYWLDDQAAHFTSRPLILDRGIYFVSGLKTLYGYALR
jgi:outer membrane protein assembly factor BamB